MNVRLILRAPLCLMLLIVITGHVSAGDMPFYFTNHQSMVKAALESKLTNRFERWFSTEGLAVLPPDFLTNLFAELKSSGFPTLVTLEDKRSAQRIPNFEVAVCLPPDNLSVSFCFLADSKRDGMPYKRFEECARFYVGARFAGHTTNYIIAAIQEFGVTNVSPRLLDSLEHLRHEYWIPFKWFEKSEWPGYWLVRDGEFAWMFHTMDNDHWWCQRRDGKEFDPQYMSQFAAARAEVHQILRKRVASEMMDTEYFVDQEMQRVLKQRFGINWRTPEDLRFPQN